MVQEAGEGDEEEQGLYSKYMKFLSAENKDEMVFMLETGMNICIYGVGSKINYLKKLTNSLKAHPLLVINAYHPGMTLKAALKKLTSHINDIYIKTRQKQGSIKAVYKFYSMHDNIEYILKMLSLEVLNIPKIYIIVVSIDAGNIKIVELQKHISTLARCDKIGMIVTTDTLKPGAFWDDTILDRYNFVFYQIDTYEEFYCEKELSTPLFSMKNEREELGLSYVLKSFTGTQVQVIKIISKFQLDNPHEPGLKEKELYED